MPPHTRSRGPAQPTMHALQRFKDEHSSRVRKTWPRQPRWPNARQDLMSRGMEQVPLFNSTYFLTALQALMHLPAFLELIHAHGPSDCRPLTAIASTAPLKYGHPRRRWLNINKMVPGHSTGCLACAVRDLAIYYWSNQNMVPDPNNPGTTIPGHIQHGSNEMTPINELVGQVTNIGRWTQYGTPHNFIQLILYLIRACHLGRLQTPYNPGTPWHDQWSALFMNTVGEKYVCQTPCCGHDSSTLSYPSAPPGHLFNPEPWHLLHWDLSSIIFNRAMSPRRPPLPAGQTESLTDCIDRAFNHPNAAAVQLRHCPNCLAWTPHRSGKVILGAAECLVIQIDPMNGAVKNTVCPEIPLDLDLTQYQHAHSRGSPLKYTLSSVIYHAGRDPANAVGIYAINVKRAGDRNVSYILNDTVDDVPNGAGDPNPYDELRSNPLIPGSVYPGEATLAIYTRDRRRVPGQQDLRITMVDDPPRRRR